MQEERIELEQLREEAKILMERDYRYYSEKYGPECIPCRIFKLWALAIEREPIEADALLDVAGFISRNPFQESIQFEMFKARVQVFARQLWEDRLKNSETS